MAETKQDTPSESPPKPKKPLPTRSPSFPFIDLKAALERAEQFRTQEGRNAANSDVVVDHWGYSAKSSGGKQTLAALRSFGLLEGEGRVKLTEDALRILMDKRDPSPERDALIRAAALRPPIHRRLWDRYAASLPSNANLRHVLLFEEKFNENSVDAFMREYKATIEFARLGTNGASMSVTGEEEEETPPPAGDSMQAEPLPLTPERGGALPPAPRAASAAPPSSPEGTLMLSVPFHGTTLSVRIDVKGELRKEHIRRVVAHLNLAEADLPGESAAPKKQAEKAKQGEE